MRKNDAVLTALAEKLINVSRWLREDELPNEQADQCGPLTPAGVQVYFDCGCAGHIPAGSVPLACSLHKDGRAKRIDILAPPAALDREALTSDERAELDRILAGVMLPTFTKRECEIAAAAVRATLALLRPAPVSEEP